VDTAAISAYLDEIGLPFESIDRVEPGATAAKGAAFTIQFTELKNSVAFVAMSQHALCGEVNAQVKFLPKPVAATPSVPVVDTTVAKTSIPSDD
jgi:hypothetical protein